MDDTLDTLKKKLDKRLEEMGIRGDDQKEQVVRELNVLSNLLIDIFELYKNGKQKATQS